MEGIIVLWIVLWIVLSILIASFGRNRKIGFGRALLFSLLLSPLIGLIAVLLSEKHSESLMKLKIAHDSGNMDDKEYNKAVRKITPNKEDRKNMLIGYAVVAIVAVIIWLIARIFG